MDPKEVKIPFVLGEFIESIVLNDRLKTRREVQKPKEEPKMEPKLSSCRKMKTLLEMCKIAEEESKYLPAATGAAVGGGLALGSLSKSKHKLESSMIQKSQEMEHLHATRKGLIAKELGHRIKNRVLPVVAAPVTYPVATAGRAAAAVGKGLKNYVSSGKFKPEGKIIGGLPGWKDPVKFHQELGSIRNMRSTVSRDIAGTASKMKGISSALAKGHSGKAKLVGALAGATAGGFLAHSMFSGKKPESKKPGITMTFDTKD